MRPPHGGARLSAQVYYDSGVSRAVAAMPDRKAETWTPEGGRTSFSDRDNFVTNRVTVSEYLDGLAAGNGAAEGLSATYACVTLIGGTTGSIPPAVLRPGEGGINVEDKRHPLFELLHESPNADWTAVDFWDFMASAVELAGNAYAVIERAGDGRAIALTPPPVSPLSVRAQRRDLGRVFYTWHEDGRAREVPQENMLHLRGPGGLGLCAPSTLAACRGTFSGALSAQAAALATFANGVRSSGVLSTEARLDGPRRSELEQLVQDKFMGALQSGRPMLLDGGLKWEQLSIDPGDAQLLETRKFGVEEICRIFGVPPFMIGHTEKSTSWGTGLEQQTIAFLVFTMRRRLKRIEARIKKQLLSPRDRAEGVTVKFDLRELLRGDSKGRAEYYERMSRIGAMTVNEVRAEENLPPVAGGDVPRVLMQNVPITEAGAEPSAAPTSKE